MTDKISEIRARHERDNRYGDGLYPGAHKDRAWLLAEVERLRWEMPVAESLRVDVKCAEIERDEARAAVWKQAKEIADLRAEVEQLTRDRAALWAEVERLREALRKASCACSAITECVSAQDEDGNCPHFRARNALEAKP